MSDAPVTPEQIRALFDERLTINPAVTRWGKFDRLLVGVLLDEITRLQANAHRAWSCHTEEECRRYAAETRVEQLEAEVARLKESGQ